MLYNRGESAKWYRCGIYEREKETKYQRLSHEIEKKWDINDIVINSIVVVTFEVIKSFVEHLELFSLSVNTIELNLMGIKKNIRGLQFVLRYG